MMRTATPGTTVGSGGDPAAISPITGSSTGESCSRRRHVPPLAPHTHPSLSLGSGGIAMAERTSSDEHEAVGVGKRDTRGRQWPNISQNALKRLFHQDHAGLCRHRFNAPLVMWGA